VAKMNHQWEIVYWSEENEKQPLEGWLDSLTNEQLKSVSKELFLLERCGNALRLPHSKALGKGLFELRDKHFGFRIYYGFLPNKKIVLLHAGDKSSQKKDIEIARLRLAKLNERQDNENKKF
jgi:putative addiction module killer protein